MRAAYKQKQGAVQERHRKAAEVAQLVAAGRTTVPNPSILPNSTPQDMVPVTVDINDLNEPPAGSSSSSSSSSSPSSAPGTTSGPKAGTNQEEEEHDSCEEFDNPNWLHEYTMAQRRKTCSNASILLPHMQ